MTTQQKFKVLKAYQRMEYAGKVKQYQGLRGFLQSPLVHVPLYPKKVTEKFYNSETRRMNNRTVTKYVYDPQELKLLKAKFNNLFKRKIERFKDKGFKAYGLPITFKGGIEDEE